MIKHRSLILFVLIIALAFSVSLTGCGNDTKGAAAFEKTFNEIAVPVTKDSADAINEAYDQYYLLVEELRDSVSDKKKELDKFADICNGIIAVEIKADEIGEYVSYGNYSKRVAAAKNAYDAMMKIDSSYASDATVSSAKSKIDAAQNVLKAKDAQVANFTDKVNALKDFGESGQAYSKWVAALGEAQSLFVILDAEGDDITSRSEITALKNTLNARALQKAALDAIADDFNAKVTAAQTAVGDNPEYNKLTSEKVDAADNAKAAADAAGLLGDEAVKDAEKVLAEIHISYDGIRYVEEFRIAVERIDTSVTPDQLADLESAIDEADAAYELIPVQNREEVTAESETLASAKNEQARLSSYKAFKESVDSVKLAAAESIAAAKTALDASKALYDGLENYVSGSSEYVEAAKTALDAKNAEFAVLKDYVDAVDALPESITATEENYTKLAEVKSKYDALSAKQKKYIIIANAQAIYDAKYTEFEQGKRSLFSTPAKNINGEDVEAGMRLPAATAEGLISSEGLRDNFLQILYAVASVKDGNVNNVELAADGTNVDDDAFNTYISENFEYAYTISSYEGDSVGGTIATFTKPVTYIEAESVPTEEEIRSIPELEISYGETAGIKYGYSVQIRLKSNAPDAFLAWMFGNSEKTDSVATLTYPNDISGLKLSNDYLISVAKTAARQLQWGRDGNVAAGANLCGYGRFLLHEAVGAYDIRIYNGSNTDRLVGWVRLVRDLTDAKNQKVKVLLGSSLDAKGFAETAKTFDEYISDGVTEVASDWLTNSKENYSDFNSKNSQFKKLINSYLGGPASGNFTILTRLVVNEEYKSRGVLSSNYSEPLVYKVN